MNSRSQIAELEHPQVIDGGIGHFAIILQQEDPRSVDPQGRPRLRMQPANASQQTAIRLKPHQVVADG
jgi:hypothetical protein